MTMETYILIIIISAYVVLLSFGLILIRQDIDKTIKEIEEIKKLL